MKNNNRFTLRLSDEQITILKEAALAEKRTAAAIVRNMIDEIKRRKDPSQRKQDTHKKKSLQKMGQKKGDSRIFEENL